MTAAGWGSMGTRNPSDWFSKNFIENPYIYTGLLEIGTFAFSPNRLCPKNREFNDFAKQALSKK